MQIKLTNPNYCATIVRVNSITKLEGLDNLVGVPIYGFQALVKNDVEIGSLGVLFTAETQLSKDYCKENNLYTKEELNKDKIKGYISEKRRVRAVKFRGHHSTALLMPLESLSYTGDISQLQEGDMFNDINGIEICKKYNIRLPGNPKVQPNSSKQRVLSKLFPEHIDTEHWGRNEHLIKDDENIFVTQKIHGTSVRLCNQITYDKVVPWWGRPIDMFFPSLSEKLFCKKEFELIAGSRKVIKTRDKKGMSFYEHDIWNNALLKYGHLIPKNWVLYGELIGWAGNSQIQKNYTYNIEPGEYEFYVYRIAIVNEDGYMVDLSHDQVIEFCEKNGLKVVPLIYRGKKADFDYKKYMDIKYYENGFKNCVRTSPESPCDEGVCIRVDGLKPRIYKAKSPIFLGHETKLLDEEVVDIESAES